MEKETPNPLFEDCGNFHDNDKLKQSYEKMPKCECDCEPSGDTCSNLDDCEPEPELDFGDCENIYIGKD